MVAEDAGKDARRANRCYEPAGRGGLSFDSSPGCFDHDFVIAIFSRNKLKD
jgi:hypothetical protein